MQIDLWFYNNNKKFRCRGCGAKFFSMIRSCHCWHLFCLIVILLCKLPLIITTRPPPATIKNSKSFNRMDSASSNLHRMLSSRLRNYELIDVKASPLPSRRALALTMRRHRRDLLSSSANMADLPQLHMKVSIYAHDLKIIFIPKRARPPDSGRLTTSSDESSDGDDEYYVDDDEFSPDVFVSTGKFNYQIRLRESDVFVGSVADHHIIKIKSIFVVYFRLS